MKKPQLCKHSFPTFNKAMDYLMFALKEKDILPEDWEIILFCCHDKEMCDSFFFVAIDFNSGAVFGDIGIAKIARLSCDKRDLRRISKIRRFRACKHKCCGVDKFVELGDKNDEPKNHLQLDSEVKK